MTISLLTRRTALAAALLASTTAVRAQGFRPALDNELLRDAFSGVREQPFAIVVPEPVEIETSTPTPKEGPAAAWAFEKSHRDPGGQSWKDLPITFAETPHIIPLTDVMWSRKQVIADFKKHKTAGQVAIAVIVKTEYCCDNGYRACAVTTAAFEKFSTPAIKKFRVYGAWVKNTRCKMPGALADPVAKTAWDAQIIAEYAFVQGPGATIELINPDDGASVHTDARVLKLYRTEFDASSGATPLLETKLTETLAQFKKK